MSDWMLLGMTREEIRVVLDRNVAKAAEIRKQAEARRPAEQAAAPRRKAPAPPARSRNAEPAKPRVGRAMRRVLAFLAQQRGPVTCAAVYRGALLDDSHLSGRQPLWRCEAAGLVRVDRIRSNRYDVTITDQGREYAATGRASINPGWGDAYRWEPGDGILDRIDAVLSELDSLAGSSSAGTSGRPVSSAVVRCGYP